MSTVIHVQDLNHHFGALQALKQLSFSVEEGEVFGMLGPNGAGKTTTVRLLNGVLAPTAGQLNVLGFDPVNQGCELRQSTGVLTETPCLYERLTARENLSIFGALYGVPENLLPRRVEELLAQFELAGRADDRVGTFSKGMKQRLALARALLHEPRLLFLDEPTAGLDPQAAQHVSRLIEELSHERGRTIVLCTHNLEEAQRLCDRVAVLNRGRLLAMGTLAELSRSLWRSTWVDFRFEEVLEPETLTSLRRFPGVNAVQPQANHLALQLEEVGCVPDLVAALVGSGARILQVVPRQHSLEEVYFELQNEQKEG